MIEIVTRLFTTYGVGYFKFDYNIDVTCGTDVNGISPGVGLLLHNLNYLMWIIQH
jgi:alpha-galactosidase